MQSHLTIEERFWPKANKDGPMTDRYGAHEAKLLSNTYRAYYDHGLHCATAEHVRVEEPECCDGCGVALGVFDTAVGALLTFVRLRAKASVSCPGRAPNALGPGPCRGQSGGDGGLCEPHEAQAELDALMTEARRWTTSTNV